MLWEEISILKNFKNTKAAKRSKKEGPKMLNSETEKEKDCKSTIHMILKQKKAEVSNKLVLTKEKEELGRTFLRCILINPAPMIMNQATLTSLKGKDKRKICNQNSKDRADN